MGHALGKEELAVIFARELHREPFAESRGTPTDIDRDIENRPFDAAYELGLGMFALLEMKAANHSIAGAAFVVLNEVDGANQPVKIFLRIAFKEISPRVGKYFGLNDIQAVDKGWNNIHD